MHLPLTLVVSLPPQTLSLFITQGWTDPSFSLSLSLVASLKLKRQNEEWTALCYLQDGTLLSKRLRQNISSSSSSSPAQILTVSGDPHEPTSVVRSYPPSFSLSLTLSLSLTSHSISLYPSLYPSLYLSFSPTPQHLPWRTLVNRIVYTIVMPGPLQIMLHPLKLQDKCLSFFTLLQHVMSSLLLKI